MFTDSSAQFTRSTFHDVLYQRGRVRKYSLDWSWSWQGVIKRPLCKFMIVIEFEHFMNILLTAYKHLCVC